MKVITTCSKRNFDYVRGLGATHCLDYASPTLTEEIKSLTNNVGLDVWVDLFGSDTAEVGI